MLRPVANPGLTPYRPMKADSHRSGNFNPESCHNRQMRHRQTIDQLKQCDVFEESKKIRSSLEKKATKYKWMSKAFTVWITAATASIPVVIGLPVDNDFVVRTVPGLLAATAALSAVLIQFEKPQERWNLYRRYQRVVEGQQLLFLNKSGAYSGRQSEAVFANSLAVLQLDLHDEWSGLIPRSSEVAISASGMQSRV